MANVSRVPDWHFDTASGHRALLEQLGVATLTGFGADGLSAAFGAAGAGFCRASFSTSYEKIHEAGERIARFLDTIPRR